jgi:predicted RNase H-like HicB family nuclease
MEFIMTFGALIIVFVIGFLVGAKQEQKRLQPKDYIPEPEVIEKLQKLAGIIEHDRSNGSKELAEIIEGLEKKKDAAISNFKSVVIDGNELKHAMINAKEILDKSIESTKRTNEIRKQWDESKKKKNPKQFDGTKSSETFVKTRKKSTTKKTK